MLASASAKKMLSYTTRTVIVEPPCVSTSASAMRPFRGSARFAVRTPPEIPGASKEEHMTHLTRLFAAAALAGVAAAPAAAQYQSYPYQTYPQQYPYQSYPQQYPQTYQGYGQQYGQGYTGNPVTDIIDQLLGNRYNVTDRQAVRRCANAAMSQAAAQYGGGYGGYNGYNNYNGYNRGNGAFRVTSISDVERRSYGLRVSGLMSSTGGYGGGYGGYRNQAYGAGQLSFRCNVDYNGSVTGVRVRPVSQYRSY
jgi:hypothetical protein